MSKSKSKSKGRLTVASTVASMQIRAKDAVAQAQMRVQQCEMALDTARQQLRMAQAWEAQAARMP